MVTKTKISNPAAVRVGAVPPGKSTDAGQFTVCEPPLVRKSVKPQSSSLAVGLLKVKVVVAVSTVAVTLLPRLMSISWVPPPIDPIAFVISP